LWGTKKPSKKVLKVCEVSIEKEGKSNKNEKAT